MKKRREEVQVFSISFLDVISCALGGTLLLLILNMQYSRAAADNAARNAAAAARNADRLRGDVDRLANSLAQASQRAAAAEAASQKAQKQAEDAAATRDKALREGKSAKQGELAANERARQAEAANRRQQDEINDLVGELDEALRELTAISSSLVGLRGDLVDVVFVFDTSGSMIGNYANNTPSRADQERFHSYKEALGNWIQTLKFNRFNVIQFSGEVVRAWKPGQMVDATEENRKAAAQFVQSWKAEGKTPTRQALEMALSMPDVKRIILFSDGEPSDAKIPEILEYLRQNTGKDLVIDTVGMGNYFNRDYGEFLKTLARQHHGVFIGR